MNINEPKVSKNRQKKETLVAEMGDKVGKAKGLVFTNYQGLTHQQIEGLKKAAKALEAEYVIIKNRLLLRALEGARLDEDTKTQFREPTATLFMYADIVEPLKELAKSIRDIQLPTIKFGIISAKEGTNSGREGFQILNAEEILKLSTLPALPALRAQLLGQMQSPIAGLHRALSWNLQNLVLTLRAIQKTKSA